MQIVGSVYGFGVKTAACHSKSGRQVRHGVGWLPMLGCSLFH